MAGEVRARREARPHQLFGRAMISHIRCWPPDVPAGGQPFNGRKTEIFQENERILKEPRAAEVQARLALPDWPFRLSPLRSAPTLTDMVTLEVTHTVPLGRDPDGVIRVTGSRVTLDSIVDEFERGATPEQIQEDFPSLTLREIYGVVAYYLDHREVTDEYCRQQEQAAAQTRRRLKQQPGLKALRARIADRRTRLSK